MKIKKLYVPFLIVVMSFTMCAPAFAANTPPLEPVTDMSHGYSLAQLEEIEHLAQSADTLSADILMTNQYTNGMQYIKTVDNIDTLRDMLRVKHPNASDYELGKTILRALGDDEDYIETLPVDKVLDALTYSSLTQTETFFRELENGEWIEISKEQYYSSTNNTVAANTDDYTDTQPFDEIILRSAAYKRNPNYALPGRNYYTIRGEVEWTGYPNYQGEDVLVAASSGNIDNDFRHYAFATWENTQGTVSETAYKNAAGTHISLTYPPMFGVGAQFQMATELPNAKILKRASCYYGVSSQNDITCQISYAHAKIVWTPGFSIDASGTVSFGGASIQRQVFYASPFTLAHI